MSRGSLPRTLCDPSTMKVGTGRGALVRAGPPHNFMRAARGVFIVRIDQLMGSRELAGPCLLMCE